MMGQNTELDVKVVGLGGIGNPVARDVAKYLCFQRPGSVLSLIDGDSYEPRNIGRQEFGRYGPKADVLGEEIQSELRDVAITSFHEWLTLENMGEFIYNGSIVLLAVDNHGTRKDVSNFCKGLSQVTVISGSNELSRGLVQIYRRAKFEDLSLPLVNNYHLDIGEAPSFTPPDQSIADCEQRQEEDPQWLVTNKVVAVNMFSAFHAVVTDTICVDEIKIDVNGPLYRTVERKPQ